MLTELVYDETFMKEIIKKYSGCLTELESLVKLMKEVESNLKSNYTGNAEKGLETLFNILNKHLDTYGESILTTKNYVTSAIESAILVDKLISNKMIIGVPEK
jgi:uncharacterized protein YukE